MRYENGRVSGIRLAYVGGGSSAWAWKFMADLASEPDLDGEIILYDIDRGAAEANAALGNGIGSIPGVTGHWRYRVADTLKEALRGADFVIISILPGTFDEMEVDVHLPERLGVWQSVGDTAGPGGIIRALRTLPMFVPIAETVREVCPEAWVINYTNPMAQGVQLLYHVFPKIKAFGCCHEVFGTQELLAKAVSETLGVPLPARREIHVNVLGINHFTWFDEASYKGIDLFPVYRGFVEKHYADGYDDPENSWRDSVYNCAHRVKFDLFRRFGYIAAAGDRHLAEFMPGNEYLQDPETAGKWKFTLTPVQLRRDDKKERLEKRSMFISGAEQMDLTPSGEEGILLMKALLGLERVASNVNVPNIGQISNLPLGTVVETNALFARNSIKPVMAGALSEELRALMTPHVENHKLILRAALTCDREAVVRAFLNDPNMAAKCTDEKEIRSLVDDMLEGTMSYLPDGWKQ